MNKTEQKVRIPFIFIVIIGFIVISILMHMFTYTNKYNHYALIKEFGKVVNITDQPGLYVKKPFIQSIQTVYSGNRIYDMAKSDVITKDKKSMIADNYVIWKVVDAKKFYQTLGAASSVAEERIDAAVYNATKNTISTMSQDEIIAARGDQLTTMITKEANTDIDNYGISIVVSEIKALDLPDDNRNAVYERMISERQNIAASYKAQGDSQAQKIKNEADKTATITLAEAKKNAEKVIAEGEAEYMKILSSAYNVPEKAEFYNYIRSLDATKASLKGKNKTLILDKESELAKILYGNV